MPNRVPGGNALKGGISMFSLFAATEPSAVFALEWLAWIVLVAIAVSVFIALTIKSIYLVLQLFSKPEAKKK